MNRKKFLKNTLLATGALAGASVLSSCGDETTQTTGAPNVITNKKYRWKMVTTWPPNFPVLGEGANLFAEMVKTMSGGRLEIKVYGGGELVPALEAFDTVSSGIAEVGSGAAYYWAGKVPAAQFFAAVPFGMNAQQSTAWILSGGGYELWREIYAKFNLVPFIGGNTGIQMGGWFNKEVNTVEDLKGLKMRIPGLGGKVLEMAGGAAVLVAGGEIYTSLERSVIDATEWIGPYHDYKMGFHKIAKYYYNPGWHEPGATLEFFVNKSKYEQLPDDLKQIVEKASAYVHTWTLAEFDAKNGIYLDKLINEEKVNLRSFPEEVLTNLRKYTNEAIADMVNKDPLSKKVYDSYSQFKKRIQPWSNITEKAYYNQLMG